MSVITAPPGQTRPPRASTRRLDIQGLRAIAVTVVIAYHAGVPFLPGGFTGVDMFFVISGYVITEMLLRQWRADGRILLGQFFLRRFTRLIPALALAVVVTAVIATVVLPPLSDENRVLWTAVGAMTITANVVLLFQTGDYFGQVGQLNPLLHTWSLSVEEQFYLVFPLVIVAALLAGRGRALPFAWLGLSIGVIFAVSLGLTLASSWSLLPFGDALFGFYSPISRSWEFAAGALLALTPHTWRRLSGGWATGIASVGLALIVLSVVLITPAVAFPGAWTLLPVVGTVLLIFAGGQAGNNPVSQLVGRPGFTHIGDWSYSLYLWHWPLIVFAGVLFGSSPVVTLFAVIAAFIVSPASYYLVENPLRHMVLDTAASKMGFVGLVVAIPALVLFAVWWVSTRIIVPALEDAIGKPTELSFSRTTDCLTGNRFTDDWATRCTIGADRPGDPIYLIGDSTAAHLDEGLLIAGETLNRPVTIITAHSCFPSPYLSLVWEDGTKQHRHCQQYHDYLESYFTTEKSGTIVMAFTDGTSRDPSTFYQDDDGNRSSETEQKLQLVTSALQRVVTDKTALGYDVIIAQPVPTFREVGPRFVPLNCSIFDLLDDTCATPVSQEEMDTLQEPIRQAIAQVADTTKARTIEFRDEWCRDGLCSPSQNGVLVYSDDIHISADQSRALAPRFVDILQQR